MDFRVRTLTTITLESLDLQTSMFFMRSLLARTTPLVTKAALLLTLKCLLKFKLGKRTQSTIKDMIDQSTLTHCYSVGTTTTQATFYNLQDQSESQTCPQVNWVNSILNNLDLSSITRSKITPKISKDLTWMYLSITLLNNHSEIQTTKTHCSNQKSHHAASTKTIFKTHPRLILD